MTASLPKSPLASRTILGVVLSLVFKLMALYGAEVSPELQGEITQLAFLAASFAGDAVAVWGRFRAERPLRLLSTGGGDPGGGIARLFLLAFLFGALAVTGPVACASKVETETPQQQVYAIKSDLVAVQTVAATMVESPQTPAVIVTAIRTANAVAVAAVDAAEAAVRGGDPATVPALIAAAVEAVDQFHQLTRGTPS